MKKKHIPESKTIRLQKLDELSQTGGHNGVWGTYGSVKNKDSCLQTNHSQSSSNHDEANKLKINSGHGNFSLINSYVDSPQELISS